DGDGLVFERLKINRDAEGRADLILPPVKLADASRVVVNRAQYGLQIFLNAFRQLDDTRFVFLEGEDGDFDRRELWGTLQHDARVFVAELRRHLPDFLQQLNAISPGQVAGVFDFKQRLRQPGFGFLKRSIDGSQLIRGRPLGLRFALLRRFLRFVNLLVDVFTGGGDCFPQRHKLFSFRLTHQFFVVSFAQEGERRARRAG